MTLWMLLEDMSGYRKREVPTLVFVRFIMRRRVLFPCHRTNRCIIALDAEQGEMYLPS